MANTVQIEKLAAEIGENIYIGVADWHLYLSDAHLHTHVAERSATLLENRTVEESAVLDILKSIQVPMGGGQVSLSLSQLIPTAVQQDLVKLLEDYQDRW